MPDSVAHICDAVAAQMRGETPEAFLERRPDIAATLPRRIRAHAYHVLVEFEAKPTMSAGGLHLPLSQQVEPQWARCISVGHLVRERIPVGARLLVKEWMNGHPCVGTPWHWMTEDDVLGVEEA